MATFSQMHVTDSKNPLLVNKFQATNKILGLLTKINLRTTINLCQFLFDYVYNILFKN